MLVILPLLLPHSVTAPFFMLSIRVSRYDHVCSRHDEYLMTFFYVCVNKRYVCYYHIR